MEVMKASSLWTEFKDFAFKGNMIDLAVAVVIGGAFGKVIGSIVDDIILPLVAFVMQILHIPHDPKPFHINDFFGSIVNFLIIAACVFIVIVKLLGMIMKAAQHAPPPAPSEPPSKECPYCLSVIPIKATKCAHCTSELPAIA
jgi:large conductance mechanosensitive channel